MLILENVPLAPMTTLEVGGPARYFTEATSIEAVKVAVEHAQTQRLPLFVLGGGSNLVVSDTGWPGLVLKVGVTGIEETQDNGGVHFEVGAGEAWDRFVGRAVARHCGGIECLSGIPGSVGGTPVQNVGAYGQEVSNTIESVQVLDLRDNQIRELCPEACGFSYRSSIFNTSERGRYIILRVSFLLQLGAAPSLKYADLKRYFAGWSVSPTLAEARDAVRRIRSTKAMLIVPGDEDCRSAGSFFKNPILTREQWEDVNRRAALRGVQVPSYPALDTRKISAAWLVERSGFSKGYSSGNVGISRKHALALVNRGNASAAEILTLKEQIQNRVEEIWGIRLEAEPVFVGF